MTALFLEPNAASQIEAMSVPPDVKAHLLEVITKGYTVVRGALPPELCEETISTFHRFERTHEAIFAEHRDADGHYPRIVNLHAAMHELIPLFTRNSVWLQTQDILFGARTSLYTSLFYETGSQQTLHRDTPVFCTRPEYLYFGTTVYLEDADDDNGCLQVMEYGHMLEEPDREAIAIRRFGSLENVPPIDNDAWVEYQEAVLQQGSARGLPVRNIHVKAGDSLIWHPQLPHGGSPIRDKSRTRFSLVMHTVPVGVPVYHQNVFFNPRKEFPTAASWEYSECEGRKIVNHHSISFGHKRDYTVDEFSRSFQG